MGFPLRLYSHFLVAHNARICSLPWAHNRKMFLASNSPSHLLLDHCNQRLWNNLELVTVCAWTSYWFHGGQVSVLLFKPMVVASGTDSREDILSNRVSSKVMLILVFIKSFIHFSALQNTTVHVSSHRITLPVCGTWAGHLLEAALGVRHAVPSTALPHHPPACDSSQVIKRLDRQIHSLSSSRGGVGEGDRQRWYLNP